MFRSSVYLLGGLMMMQVAVARARSRSVESVSSPWDTATVRPNETTRPTQRTSATFTPDSTEALFYTTDLTGAHNGTYGRLAPERNSVYLTKEIATVPAWI